MAWGQRGRTNASAKEAPRALSAIDDLFRHAEWDRLPEETRAALLSPYQALDVTKARAADGRVALSAQQDWVADLTSRCFQQEIADVMRTWLALETPDAHLFVGGGAGLGRQSQITALARAIMAQRPAPPDYCYVPDPDAMSQALLLAVPAKSGEPFLRALVRVLGALGEAFGDEKLAAEQHAGLVAQAFDQVSQAAPEQARAYLARLRAAILAKDELPPLGGDDAPIGLAAASSADAAGEGGAPVVAISLLQSGLTKDLIRANGGVLVLPAMDLLVVNGAWQTLFAALTARAVPYNDGWPPLPLNVRVALIGPGAAYAGLKDASDAFYRLFRYEVWNNARIHWTNESEATYAALADGVARRYDLPPVDASCVARLVEEGARRVDNLNRTHLSTDLVLLHDIVAEAGRVARGRSASVTTGADVESALAIRRRQQDVFARQMRAAVLSGQEITPTAGREVGQINGLAVYDLHPEESAFAVPIRISATVTPGLEERLVDIEHEAERADSDHVRGALTIQGYLAQAYGRERPICVQGRVRFEQEHGTTGGDSASLAVLVTLLSALAEAPIHLSLAVTGAVGQYGEIQPIGDVNTKIAGFWDICRLRRSQGELTPAGGYGVLIPAINTRDLMLRPEVADSIARGGWFHVWPVSTVDDAITLLTGVPAPEFHKRVNARLKRFHELAVRSRRGF
ncbi:MAG TPA: Lon-insertion domain-containing protein [Ktedonobacterales bacterium]|nr:Lon-insertion domain-containing protein [Ktedonobacterales bacterium]